MPAGSPGAAMVNRTMAGQAASITVQLRSKPKTYEMMKGPYAT
jgi:hypothetical protein